MWMVINSNIKESKMQRKFKMHENGKKWDAGGVNSRKGGAEIKIKSGPWTATGALGWFRERVGLRLGRFRRTELVQEGVYKGCNLIFFHFPNTFLSLPPLCSQTLCSLSSLSWRTRRCSFQKPTGFTAVRRVSGGGWPAGTAAHHAGNLIFLYFSLRLISPPTLFSSFFWFFETETATNVFLHKKG